MDRRPEHWLKAPRLLLQATAPDACDAFCSRASADFANVMATGTSSRMRVAGAIHMNFSDTGLMFSLANGVILGSINQDRMTDIMRDTIRTFLDVHVRDAPAGESTQPLRSIRS